MGKNVLILGARAPIAADLARVLSHAGHHVWAADSLRFPVGRWARGVKGFIRLPPPRQAFAAFCRKLSETCERLQLDSVVPVSEEVFWLALAAPHLPTSVSLRTRDHETLAGLHDKARFARLAETLGYGAPESVVVSAPEGLAPFRNSEAWVFKPIYSRFASRVLLRPSVRALASLRPSSRDPWLAQRFVEGCEYCCYNVAEQGRVLLHVAYEPRRRLGIGASLCFEPITHEGLLELSRSIVAATKFTGQISFDVIETTQGLVALECNPRGTSGVHLAAQRPDVFAEALLGVGADATVMKGLSARLLRLPLLLSHPRLVFSREGREEWRRTPDAMEEAGISVGHQSLALVEIAGLSIFKRLSLQQATTMDIEWNGETPEVLK